MGIVYALDARARRLDRLSPEPRDLQSAQDASSEVKSHELVTDRARARYDDLVLAHCGGPGVDRIATKWAERNGVHQIACNPDWDRDGLVDEVVGDARTGVIPSSG